MSSGSSKQAMDKARTITEEGEVVPDVDERSRSLWSRINLLIHVAVGQVMDMITGVLPDYDLEAKADILQFSAEHCAALAKDEPIDEQVVWEAYDHSVRLLDIVVMIPVQWEKYLDPSFWDLPPLEKVPRVKPLGKADFDKIKKMPYTYQLHLDELPRFAPKYQLPKQLPA